MSDLSDELFAKLGTDELNCIVHLIDKDALFAFSLTCRAARAAVLDTKRVLRTSYQSLLASIAMTRWAIKIGVSKNSLKNLRHAKIALLSRMRILTTWSHLALSCLVQICI